MAVVGPHRHPEIFPAIRYSFLLFYEKCLHYVVDVYIAFEMVLFEEVAVGIPRHVPQVNEVHPVGERPGHLHEIVLHGSTV